MVAKLKKHDDLGGIVLSTQGMAKLLGITPRWLQKLVKDGELSALGRGQFDPYETVQAYVELQKRGQERATASDQLENLREVKANAERIKLMRAERSLIALDEAVQIVDEIGGVFLAYLSGLPAEITGNRKERARIDDIIDDGRSRLSARFAKAASALASGLEDPEAEAEDDAA